MNMRKLSAMNLAGAFALLLLFIGGAAQAYASPGREATAHTKAANDAVYDLLDFSDEREFEFARRGLLAAPESLEIKDEKGNIIWSQKAFDFVEGQKPPDTANPGLWRHTRLNHIHGLFEVVDGIYQVRGYDLSNITFIRGESGWIIFDPLTNVETARAALALVNETLGERPVAGVVVSHPHIDHYGGIRGVVSEDEVKERRIPIIVPRGFEESAISENIYAGNAMKRRSDYMYGRSLTPGERGRLAVGLGVGMPEGSSSYIPPNDWITETGQIREIDGVKMVFQVTPGTEAPVEMNTYFPDKKALWMAENCTGTLHNLYTLRGAQVRDGNAWAKYIMEAITLYGGEAEVVFQSHNWPHWGNGVINEYMLNTAAIYKFIHDQTLMYLNQGHTPNEISGMMKLPAALEKVWYTRQYYGTVKHDAKAVYQRYMGWYDANPAHLDSLPPVQAAQKTVEYIGGVEEALKKARADFDRGEYQWVAEFTMTLVFADPENREARRLCADALEQLGYQAESGVWRAAYLTGAKELREGAAKGGMAAGQSGDMLRAMEPYMVFDYMGIHIDSNAGEDLNLKINFQVAGDADYLVTVKSGVLLYQRDVKAADADATVRVPKTALASLLSPDWEKNGLVAVEGDKELFRKLMALMVKFEPNFNIIEP